MRRNLLSIIHDHYGPTVETIRRKLEDGERTVLAQSPSPIQLRLVIANETETVKQFNAPEKWHTHFIQNSVYAQPLQKPMIKPFVPETPRPERHNKRKSFESTR